jgi:hypothetical protein
MSNAIPNILDSYSYYDMKWMQELGWEGFEII